MNIFVLHTYPKTAAQLHNDKHCVKMILESAQLLSTAHRILDGTTYVGQSTTGRRVTRWRLPDHRETLLLSATHTNHPCNIWVRSHLDHYMWLTGLFSELLQEYTFRYNKQHKYESLRHVLSCAPTNISTTGIGTAPPQAMPDTYKVQATDSVTGWDATVQAYHNYYRGAKVAFSTWKHRDIPTFMKEPNVCVS